MRVTSPPDIKNSNLAKGMEYPREIEHGLMFHYFHNERHPKGQGSLSQKDFANLLDFVGVHRILSPFEWLDKLASNKLEKQHLCITFDDALLCQFEIALPVLEARNLKAFWFVHSSVFEGHLGRNEIYRIFRSKYFQNVDAFYSIFFRKVSGSEFSERTEAVLEEEQIKNLLQQFPFYSVNDAKFRFMRDRALGKQNYETTMDEIILEHRLALSDLSKDLWMSNEHLSHLNQNGHVIGLHSYSHPTVLAGLSYEEQFREYEKNYLHVKEVCRRSPVAMAHPCNSYNDDTIEILKHLGIRCGFRSNMFPRAEGERANPHPFEMARQDQANIMRMMERS